MLPKIKTLGLPNELSPHNTACYYHRHRDLDFRVYPFESHYSISVVLPNMRQIHHERAECPLTVLGAIQRFTALYYPTHDTHGGNNDQPAHPLRTHHAAGEAVE